MSRLQVEHLGLRSKNVYKGGMKFELVTASSTLVYCNRNITELFTPLHTPKGKCSFF